MEETERIERLIKKYEEEINFLQKHVSDLKMFNEAIKELSKLDTKKDGNYK